MAQYGLGEFLYDQTVDGKNVNFKFFDPNDVNNTAEVSLGEKDFPEGIVQPDSRQVADVAYAKVAKQLNDKRDARIKQEQIDQLDKQQEADQHARDVAADFHANAQDVQTEPAKTEKDGTNVYNTETASKSDSKK